MSNPDLAKLLEGERPWLDRIFGEGAYRVETTDPHQVSVRSVRLKLELGYDARDRSIGSTLEVTEEWGTELDSPYGWARFLGEEVPPWPRNPSGHVTLTPEEQVRAELKWLARLSAELFSDPQKTRDAVNFVRGYRAAYNDWATGAWDPD